MKQNHKVHEIYYAKAKVDYTYEELIGEQWADITRLAGIIGQSRGQFNLEAKFRMIIYGCD